VGAAQGIALDIQGTARFTSCGAGSVGAKTDTTTVVQPKVTALSHITITFVADPGDIGGFWVQRQPGTGFVLHLAKKSDVAAPFTYFVVEPGV
jgi:hypothetical protein